MLIIEKLYKSFSANHVLNGLDLTVESGALTAIIGPNGCGKSTLFNLITGALTPDSGNISFQGQQLKGLKPREIAKKGVLRKFQVPGIYPNLTVKAHLELPFIIKKQSIDPAAVKQMASQMGLTDWLEYTGSRLATGQKQWLEMAMLVLLKPTLLLLDEPIAGMTATEAGQTLAILKQLNRDGLTIVTIEHNIDFVKQLTDDIAVIMQGQVIKRSCYDEIAGDNKIREGYLGSLYA